MSSNRPGGHHTELDTLEQVQANGSATIGRKVATLSRLIWICLPLLLALSLAAPLLFSLQSLLLVLGTAIFLKSEIDALSISLEYLRLDNPFSEVIVETLSDSPRVFLVENFLSPGQRSALFSETKTQ